MKNTAIKLAAGALALLMASAAPGLAAPLQNGDFSAGFTGWQAEVTDSFTLDVIPVADPGTFGAEFATNAGLGTATLSDSLDFFEVFLFQVFDLPTVAMGGTVTLFYEVSESLTDLFDFPFAQLDSDFDGTFFNFADDLLVGTSLDVTSLAGQTVQLLFGVSDGDFIEQDSITFGNFAITVEEPAASDVPEPGTVGLMGMALLLLAAARSRHGRARGAARRG